MTPRPLPCLLLATATPALVSAAPPPAGQLDGTQWAQVVITRRIIIHIAPPTLPRNPRATRWVERKAPPCVPVSTITSAKLQPQGGMELTTVQGTVLRAELDEQCPTLDFYPGIYFKISRDGQVCAKRDAIRSRSGARCRITQFRAFEARR